MSTDAVEDPLGDLEQALGVAGLRGPLEGAVEGEDLEVVVLSRRICDLGIDELEDVCGDSDARTLAGSKSLQPVTGAGEILTSTAVVAEPPSVCEAVTRILPLPLFASERSSPPV